MSRKNKTRAFKLQAGCAFFKALPVFFYFFLLPSSLIPAEKSEKIELPVIKNLDVRKDDVFKQYLADVEAGAKLIPPPYGTAAPSPLEKIAESLRIYIYYPHEGDTLLNLISVYYKNAVATLNRIDNQTAPLQKPLLLPTLRGIFIPEDPPFSDFEILIASSRMDSEGTFITIPMPDGTTRRFFFIPGDNFKGNEIAFFVTPGFFIYPLKNYTLTSAFGRRVSPITGRASMHKGLDLAAPAGTPVFAAHDGRVVETGENGTYGKFIIISHEQGWTSLYGHLSKVEAAAGRMVKKGDLIGRVGSTGLSTGPHLHFEIRKNGKAQDPSALSRKS